MNLGVLLTAWFGHTDASREMAADFSDALGEHGVKRSTAAETMGLTNEQQLSRQVAGNEPMQLYRLAALPAAVRLAFYRRQVARLGGLVLDESQAEIVRGAARLGTKRMAKIAPEAVFGAVPERRRA